MGDILTENELGKVEKASKAYNKNWDEKIKSWDKYIRISMYKFIDLDKEEAVLLKEKLQINDTMLEKEAFLRKKLGKAFGKMLGLL